MVAPRPTTLFLASKAAGGEPEARDLLLERIRPRIVAYIASRLGPRLRARTEAEDLAQEVLIHAYRALPAFRPEGSSSIHRWLFRIAKNVVADAADYHTAAKRTALREVALADECASRRQAPDADLQLREEMAASLRILDSLWPRYREVLRLRDLEGRPNHEVAELLGVTPNTAAVLHLRARRALGRLLDRRRGDPAAA
jgi:RNA polymerase sigma-70 factor (ECF subfamily)